MHRFVSALLSACLVAVTINNILSLHGPPENRRCCALKCIAVHGGRVLQGFSLYLIFTLLFSRIEFLSAPVVGLAF